MHNEKGQKLVKLPYFEIHTVKNYNFFYQTMYSYEATKVWVNHEYNLTLELNFKKPLYEHDNWLLFSCTI